MFIYRFEDGIFSSELTFSDDINTITLDARTSDAIALAIRSEAPIFTTRDILDETGFIIEEPDDEGSAAEAALDSDPSAEPPERKEPSIEEMEQQLQQLIDNEDYEEAARLKKIIESRKRQ